jgi:parallel beta-helix repeat protein
MLRLLVLLILFLPGIVEATTYFVSTTGSDSTGNGSINSPWRWPKKCFSSGSPLVGGDVCFINAGTYQGADASIWSGDTSVPSGTSGAYTTIQGAGRTLTILKPTSHGFAFDNDNFIAVKSLTIDGTLISNVPPNDQERLIRVNQGNGSWLEDLELFGAAGCIHHPELGESNVLVRNIRCHDVTRMGIYGRGITTGTYENMEVYNTGGVEILEGDTVLSTNITFRNNYIHDTRYATGPANGFGVGFTVGSGLLAYNNIVTNSVEEGFYVHQSPGAKIFNNVAYGNAAAGIACGIFSTGSLSCNISNNLTTNNAGGSIVLYNSWTNTGSNNACTAAESCGNTPKLTITGLTSCTVSTTDFHQKSGSLCIGQGRTLTEVTVDYEGTARTTPYDIGVDETGGVVPDTTPPAAPTGVFVSKLERD